MPQKLTELAFLKAADGDVVTVAAAPASISHSDCFFFSCCVVKWLVVRLMLGDGALDGRLTDSRLRGEWLSDEEEDDDGEEEEEEDETAWLAADWRLVPAAAAWNGHTEIKVDI